MWSAPTVITQCVFCDQIEVCISQQQQGNSIPVFGFGEKCTAVAYLLAPVHLVYNDEAASKHASCLFEHSAPECITFSGREEDMSAKCNQQWWNPAVQDFIATWLPILLAGRSSNQKEWCTCSHLFPGNYYATYYSRVKIVSFPRPLRIFFDKSGLCHLCFRTTKHLHLFLDPGPSWSIFKLRVACIPVQRVVVVHMKRSVNCWGHQKKNNLAT